MTRVYVPTTLAGLARAQEHGTLETAVGSDGAAGSVSVAAHAVTGAVREWYVEGNLEELEYSALIDAAEASLRLLALEPQIPRRRVVVAVDVPDDLVSPGGEHRSSVRIAGPVALSTVVSVHVDEVESEDHRGGRRARLGRRRRRRRPVPARRGRGLRPALVRHQRDRRPDRLTNRPWSRRAARFSS